MKLDPQSPWTQRAFSLRATMPAPKADEAAAPAKPAEAGKTEEKKSDASPSMQIKLPGTK
jgi:hypothetical protein